MTIIKVFDNPTLSMYNEAYLLQEFQPSEIVIMGNELWVYWEHQLYFQIKNLQPQLERKGYKLDWYEKDGLYEAMVYIQL